MTPPAHHHHNGDYGHDPYRYNDDEHGHEHPSGWRGVIHGLFVPHSHDVLDSVEDAMLSSAHGIRTVTISLLGLGATAVFQLIVVLMSGSVALLADTVHNFSDALATIPLWSQSVDSSIHNRWRAWAGSSPQD